MIKISQLVNFVIGVPESKKNYAIKAVTYLKKLDKKLNYFNDYLDKIYNPFKEYSEVSEESIVDHRGAIHNYCEEIQQLHDELKDLSSTIVYSLKIFEYDSDFLELTKSLTAEFEDISNLINELCDCLVDYESTEYQENVVKTIELLKENIDKIKESINDRLIDHINKNVLKKSWLDDIENKERVEDEPLISKLYKERNNQIKEIVGE
jgi:HPt (histidine-containing phosphotransfer) domain-containing protein